MWGFYYTRTTGEYAGETGVFTVTGENLMGADLLFYLTSCAAIMVAKYGCIVGPVEMIGA